jgi:DNA-binding NtrC family response regulator
MASLSSTVLVVDDEPAVLSLLTVLLARQHVPVDTAEDGSTAIRKMLDTSYGCLLVDKNLPDKSGLEVIAEARRLHPYCACIVMTGYPSYESILSAMRMGAVDYLEKPFPDVALVGQRVARAVEQQQIIFQRDTLAKLLRDLRGELKQRDDLLRKQQSDLELLQDLINDKVAERTQELEAKVKQLEDRLRDVGGGRP